MEEKIISLSTRPISDWPRPLIFTNGVFDILHRGHVTYLAAARSLGASLLVAVNSNESVRMLGKGPDRPLNDERDRAIVLAALESVSYVTIFTGRTPIDEIEAVRPDIYVKGGDYTIDQLPEAACVARWGGKTVLIPFVEGFSTSQLVAQIREL